VEWRCASVALQASILVEAVDNVGAVTLHDSMRAVNNGGRIIGVGNTSGPIAEIDLRDVFEKQLSLIGRMMGNYDDYRTVMGLSFQGQLKPVISRILPFEPGLEAMAMLERGEQFGKRVLTRSRSPGEPEIFRTVRRPLQPALWGNVCRSGSHVGRGTHVRRV
jgi:D-arabinose 1-dehydrogenase-like Zn-dependent alcohol dehydrogenase